jgi:hypothetical protein
MNRQAKKSLADTIGWSGDASGFDVWGDDYSAQILVALPYFLYVNVDVKKQSYLCKQAVEVYMFVKYRGSHIF